MTYSCYLPNSRRSTICSNSPFQYSQRPYGCVLPIGWDNELTAGCGFNNGKAIGINKHRNEASPAIDRLILIRQIADRILECDLFTKLVRTQAPPCKINNLNTLAEFLYTVISRLNT